MLGILPNRLDAVAVAEMLEALAHDATVDHDQGAAFARVALFLRGLHAPRCHTCDALLGSPSAWAEMLERASRDDRASAVGCRMVMRDLDRRVRGYCSVPCEKGEVRHGA